MFTWKKMGRIFNPQDIHNLWWLKEFAQGPSVLFYKDFIRIFFSCRPKPDAKGQYVSYSAFADFSNDGLFKILQVSSNPILELGVPGTFDEFGTYPVSVIRNGPEVLAFYGGWTRCVSVPFNVAIGLGVSNDNGNTFSRLGDGPVLSYSPDEPFVLSGPKIRRYNNRWYLWYIAGKKWLPNNGKPEPVYKIRMAYADDYLHWEKAGSDLICSKLEENECQASPDVFYFENKYHMFFCYRYSLDYRGKEKGYRIGYASSEDLIHWERDDTKAGIDISSEGWDSEMISYPHVFMLNEIPYMLYLGNQVGKYGFGIARLENYKS